MTFTQIIHKLKARWSWLVVAVLVGLVISLGFFSQDSFEASVTFNIHFNSDKFLENKTDSYGAYLESLRVLSNFLVTSFTSVYTQNQIATELGQNLNANKKAFFDIASQDGIVVLTYKTTNPQKAQTFIQTTQKVYRDQLIPNWNRDRLANFSIKPSDQFESIIVQNPAPLQSRILPVVAILVLALGLVILIPQKEK